MSFILNAHSGASQLIISFSIHKQSAEIRDYELALRDVERNLVIFQFVWNVLTCETCYVSQMFREIPKLCAECGKSERFREQKVKFWVCSGCKDTRYCSKWVPSLLSSCSWISRN